MAALYPVHDAATVLAVSESTVWRLIKRRELPVVRIGSSVRVSDRAIERYIERREQYAGGGKPSYAAVERVGSRWRTRAPAAQAR